MTTAQLLKLNFDEVRRRSIKVWRAIPPEHYGFRVDPQCMSLIEQVRHVLEDDFNYAEMLRLGGDPVPEVTPWSGRPLGTVDDELRFAEPHRRRFLEQVATYSEQDLGERTVSRPSRGYVRTFGDFLQRIAYHEAVHTGQLLRDLRIAGCPRPDVWD
jgi:hypothetical protein